MKSERKVGMIASLGTASLMGLMLMLSANINGSSTPAHSESSQNSPTPVHADKPNRFPYGTHNLIGASPEEVGKFAQEFVQQQFAVLEGTPQVLLSRSVTGQQITELGLGCPPQFAAIEKPPLMLVILKGHFDVSSMPGTGAIRSPVEANYIAYIFDVWAALPAIVMPSKSPSLFRKALNDPTLPTAVRRLPTVCPTAAPPKEILHYGQDAPGGPFPLPPGVQPFGYPVPTGSATP